jgi:murein DD-endopeptidase MepM/ murein hydrolase activator NlpD
LDGNNNGGVYTPINLALYSYGADNPLYYVDPNGETWYGSGDLSEDAIASGKYLEVKIQIDKQNNITLYTDNPNIDITGTVLNTAAGEVRVSEAMTEFKDPGVRWDRPVDIEDPEITEGILEKREHPRLEDTTRPHKGEDISSKRGSAAIEGKDIVAPAGGKVLRIDKQEKGAGNYVVVGHGNGRETKYFHLGKVNVTKGQFILRGTKIGTVGDTGGISTGAHLHWEFRVNGKVVTPNLMLKNPIPYR